jgi:hypothetical protein
MPSQGQPVSPTNGLGGLGGALPPVTPPSGKFIVQLFLVPGLIVCLIVCLLLVVNWLLSGARSPDDFLKRLDDSNVEVRWRAASDLAQVLLRSPELARNAGFAQKLSDRLDQGLSENEPAEKAFLEHQAKLAKEDKPEEQKRSEIEAERAKLGPGRSYLQFLAGSLGQFVVPLGASVLSRMAEEEPVMEPRALAVRRRSAVFALAVMANKLKEFDKLHPLEQGLVLDELEKQAASTSGSARQGAQATLDCLKGRLEGKYQAMGVDKALARAAEAEDPGVRELAAFAMGLWKGTAEEDRRMETALVRLASDDGRGEDRIEEFSGNDPRNPMKEVVSRPGLIVQINAMLALLRRGSDKVRPGMVLEMLDEKGLEEAIQIESKDGKKEPNRGKAEKTVTETLKALAEYYRDRPKANLAGVPDRIEELTKSNDSGIAMAAREAKTAL